MAADHALKSVTNTLSGTTADTITLDQLWPFIEVTNQDATDVVYVLMTGSLTPTAVAAADNTTLVPATKTVKLRAVPVPATNTIVVSVVGDGGVYTVEGVNQ